MIEPVWFPTDKQLRQFAVVSLFGFAMIGALAHCNFGWHNASYALWAIGAMTFAVGLALPRAVFPVYGVLMLIALPIGLVISAVLMRVLFYVVMTPLGLLFRLFRRDPLRLNKPALDSYWIARDKKVDPASYYRQA
ncbi:MAG: SxtJ family membrane protein [Proteobacteria bacterium]|nr:SxtJ family membrane protein [Pseudomonadota bacterium]